MRKYRLIKEYPGSPKLNTILTHEELQYCNWDEYYEEIVEKDYEILEIRGKYGAISSFIEKLDSDLKDKVIFKIKRLSDGEVFTIGDLVGTPGSIYPLKEFKIIDSENTLAVHCYKDKIGGSGHYNHRLKNLKKAKQPLFTTEDGVDIFEDNKYCYINSSFNNPWEIVNTKADCPYIINKNDSNYKRFSTKEKAEEYILMNKPCLSLKDIDELLCKNTSSYFLEKFKKLAQQRLNK